MASVDAASALVEPSARESRASQTKPQTLTLAVENMNCGGCLRKVENAVLSVPNVSAARANLSAKRVTATFEPGTVEAIQIIDALAEAGYRAAELIADTSSEAKSLDRQLLSRLAVAGFASANIMLFSVSSWSGAFEDSAALNSLFHWLSALIAVPAVGFAGQPFFSSAYHALKARRLNMDVPISLGVILAILMSLYQTMLGSEQVYFDAGVSLLFFLLIGRYFDLRMRLKARGAVENLLGLRAAWANVIADNGVLERLPARLVEPGMRLAIATGERFPVDGVIIAGVSEVDESLITGETTPRRATEGATVYAGSVNLSAPVQMSATAAEGDTLLAEIIRLMEAAEQARGKYVRLADRAARYYAPLVHALALVTFIGWMIAGSGWVAALTVAVAVLIITCPCALALAVPVVQVAASARLFENGLLLKAADGLERLSEVDWVVFDKTGTLTYGTPELANAADIDPRVLRRAAAIAAASKHPYALAVVKAARERFGAVEVAAGVREEPGFGLIVDGPEGEERLGSAIWCGVAESPGGEGSASLWYRAADGKTLVPFHFQDRLREDAADTVRALEAAGYKVSLLSGDRRPAVEAIAAEAQIADWHARLKPAEKIAFLEDIKAKGRKALMVGDGLNDAPALAAAHASLSPSTATDVSQTASDLVFQGAKLSSVVLALATARKGHRMALENFGVAAAYNALFVPLAMAGYVTPLIAALAMSTSSILVTANALRLRTMPLKLELRSKV